MSSKATILVSGMIAADPYQGGATWAVLQYVLGFRRLGHPVYFVEPVPANRLRPAGADIAGSVNAQYFRDVVNDFGLEGAAALLPEGSTETVGLAYHDLRRAACRCDVLFNVSGMLTDPALLEPIPRRVYLDLDPAFIQMWAAYEGVDMRFADHTHFATIGRLVGQPGCPVPTCGLNWRPTWQPVVLEHWPVALEIARDAWTTVGNWRGYGSIHHAGVHYGQKAHSMRPFYALPRLAPRERFAPALSIHPDEVNDLAALREHGWTLTEPAGVAATPADYAAFVRGSRGEFAVAKSGYVNSRCGWFSDRSVCYLASGRPVVAQDTGFRDLLPTGRGLFAFETIDEVVSAMEAVRADYPAHTRAARAIAEAVFDSDKVLPALLASVGVD